MKPLVTHRFSIEQASDAYQLISGGTSEKYLAVLLTYDTESEVGRTVENRKLHSTSTTADRVSIGLIGAGGTPKNFSCQTSKTRARSFRRSLLHPACPRATSAPVGFARFLSDAESVIEDVDANLIVIATRHTTHAELARLALASGKHVFVEKP